MAKQKAIKKFNNRKQFQSERRKKLQAIEAADRRARRLRKRMSLEASAS